jgi:RecA-family ATPase
VSEITPNETHNYLEPLSEVRPEAFDPFWINRLGFGTLAMLEGDPGEGKSLVALDLCARLSTGRPIPDGDADVWTRMS